MPTVTGIDINTDPVIVAQLQTQPSLVSRPLIYPGCKSSPCASFSPSRVYVSPLWRRSTTADGLLSLPPFSAVLWRRWWSGRVNSSQTGNCPGCRFSFPSTFSLWAELRQRASSGKTSKRMCVVSFSHHVFLSALSLSTVHRTDSRKNTPRTSTVLIWYFMICVYITA